MKRVCYIYNSKFCYRAEPDGYVLTDEEAFDNKKPTSAELAEYGDGELENANYHSMVGIYAALESIINHYANKEITRSVLMEILDKGGIEGIPK